MHTHSGPTTRLMTLLAASLTATACSDLGFGPGWDDPQIVTDQASYTARVIEENGTWTQYGFTLVARFTNKTKDDLYLGRCFPDTPIPIYGVKSVDDPEGWGAGYSFAWACVGENGFLIEPGESRVDTLQMHGPNAWSGKTGEPYGVLEGRFRLVYSVRYCLDCRDRPPEELRVSNVFRVTLADEVPGHE